MSEEHLIEGNRLSVLTTGAERIAALITLIDGAKTSLKLLYYIYARDGTGHRIGQALIAAAGRGVEVDVLLDGFGSGLTGDESIIAKIRDAGVEVCVFIPRWGRRYLLRNHQKLALADNRRALIGGFNIADAYFSDAGETAWRDLGLEVEGPAAGHLAGYFDAVAEWARQPKAKMRDLRRALNRWSNPAGQVQWLLGGPARRASPWTRAIRKDLGRGRSVSIVAAYFAPSPPILKRLDRIGPHARVLTAGKTDNPATIAAARFTFPGLLRKGVRVFEYQPHRLHTKLYVIDSVTHVGSANLDMRSLYLNLELMLRIDDARFAAAMQHYVDGEIADSRERRIDEFQGIKSILERSINTFCYFLVAVLDYNVTRRLNLNVD